MQNVHDIADPALDALLGRIKRAGLDQVGVDTLTQLMTITWDRAIHAERQRVANESAETDAEQSPRRLALVHT